MRLINKEGNCERVVSTPAKVERLRRLGFLEKTEPKLPRGRKTEKE